MNKKNLCSYLVFFIVLLGLNACASETQEVPSFVEQVSAAENQETFLPIMMKSLGYPDSSMLMGTLSSDGNALWVAKVQEAQYEPICRVSTSSGLAPFTVWKTPDGNQYIIRWKWGVITAYSLIADSGGNCSPTELFNIGALDAHIDGGGIVGDTLYFYYYDNVVGNARIAYADLSVNAGKITLAPVNLLPLAQKEGEVLIDVSGNNLLSWTQLYLGAGIYQTCVRYGTAQEYRAGQQHSAHCWDLYYGVPGDPPPPGLRPEIADATEGDMLYTQAQISEDGKYILSQFDWKLYSDATPGFCAILNTQNGEFDVLFNGECDYQESDIHVADGQYFATYSVNGIRYTWTPAGGSKVSAWLNCGGPIMSNGVLFSSDGTRVCSQELTGNRTATTGLPNGTFGRVFPVNK